MAASSITTPIAVSGLRVKGVSGVSNEGPLKSLYENKFNSNIYKFPSDLGSPNRGHVITFTVRELADQTPAFIVDKDNTASIQVHNETFTNAETDSNNTGEKAKKTQPTFFERFKEIFRVSPLRVERDTVALYVPDNVNVQYVSQYSDPSLTTALGKPLFIAQAGSSIFDSLGSFMTNNAGTTALNVLNSPFFRQAAANQIDKNFKTNITPFALSGVGYALNPQLQILYSVTGFRSFQFVFILSPKSKDEAAQIQNIIKVLKKAAAPKFEAGFVTEQSMFLKVPDTFNIKFLFNGEENLNVNRIGECVLEQIDVDYSPNGWSSFNDGSAVQTTITMQFKEIFIIDKNRIEEGY